MLIKSCHYSMIDRQFIGVKYSCTRRRNKRESITGNLCLSFKVECDASFYMLKEMMMKSGLCTTLSKIIIMSFFQIMHTILLAIEVSDGSLLVGLLWRLDL